MQESPKNISRKVIPRWRNARLTPRNEIGGVGKAKPESLDLSVEFEPLREKWRIQKDLNNAAEILFLSSFGQNVSETAEAAAFILDHVKSSNELKDFAKAVTGTEVRPQGIDRDSFVDNPLVYRGQIRSYRSRLNEYPRDPIGHVELARLYASAGQSKKAREHFRIAVNLASTNRFVLRSAARFYVHKENFDEALGVLRLGPKNDPWLVAAQISISDLASKPIKNWREGKKLLENTDDPAQIAELAAAAGTVELNAGKTALAKKYFKLAAKSPNDNVIAQLQWASKSTGFHFDDALLNRRFTFEAVTAHEFLAAKYPEAVEACLKWMFDEPFSARPATIGGFLASTALKDYSLAQMFLRQGLLANPTDAAMLNNMAYSQIMSGELNDAEQELAKAQRFANKLQKEIILPATLGLLAYRRGKDSDGADLYIQSILKASEAKEFELMHHAFLRFSYEEIRLGRPTPILDMETIKRNYDDSKTSPRVKALYKMILEPILLVSQSLESQNNRFVEYRNLIDVPSVNKLE